MDALDKYHKANALTEVNYRTRLAEAQRLIGEARNIYDDDLRKAREEYSKREAKQASANEQ